MQHLPVVQQIQPLIQPFEHIQQPVQPLQQKHPAPQNLQQTVVKSLQQPTSQPTCQPKESTQATILHRRKSSPDMTSPTTFHTSLLVSPYPDPMSVASAATLFGHCAEH